MITFSEAEYPQYEEKYIKEDSFEYPISINGKMRTKISFPVDIPKEEMENQVLENEIVQKWTEGKAPKKVIIVPKRIVNVVV
jgi:leucyl-tRNA synthetase